MSLIALVLTLGLPGGGPSGPFHPGWPEIANLAASLAIVALLCRWLVRAKDELEAEQAEKIVAFPLVGPSQASAGPAGPEGACKVVPFRVPGALVLLGAVVLSSPARAQEPAPAPVPAPEPPKVDVTGFVDVYYGYNFNKTGPRSGPSTCSTTRSP